MKHLFASNGNTPFDMLAFESGSELHLSELPAFLRVLLITDGTVTRILESYFWEPVQVKKISQHRQMLDCAMPGLEMQKGQEVIARSVALVGENSGMEYARASSFIRPQALPGKIRRELESGKVGIGELLKECGLETYRELISLGIENSSEENCVTRTYRIVMDQQPFIQITETFPLSAYTKENS
jgi:chorismate-pyruvate lyase